MKLDLDKVEIKRAKIEDYDEISKLVSKGLLEAGQTMFAKRTLKQPHLQVKN